MEEHLLTDVSVQSSSKNQKTMTVHRHLMPKGGLYVIANPIADQFSPASRKETTVSVQSKYRFIKSPPTWIIHLAVLVAVLLTANMAAAGCCGSAGARRRLFVLLF